MDTELAGTFLEIVSTESFVKAADWLNVGQTTVGARVRIHEQQLGRPLFVRHKGGGGDVLRLHDLPCPKDDRCFVANRFLALPRRGLDIRAFLPRRRKRQRTAPLRGASAGVVAL
jgi:hypothetical protein